MDSVERLVWSHQIRRYADQLRSDPAGIALSRLFDLTAPRLLRYASTVTRHRQDAEDALQSAMVRLALAPLRLAEAWHPWAYLLRMVRNEALQIGRRRKGWSLFSGEESTGEASLSDTSADEAIVERSELQESVRQALTRLPPDQSEVLVLKMWEQMTFEEIADVLDQSPNTVASRYRYAIRKLAVELRPLAEAHHVR